MKTGHHVKISSLGLTLDVGYILAWLGGLGVIGKMLVLTILAAMLPQNERRHPETEIKLKLGACHNKRDCCLHDRSLYLAMELIFRIFTPKILQFSI